jgi:DNA-directed RNA polymerase specialized sigma24 family protein
MARRDAETFTGFVLASQPALRRTAYLLCGDWSLASDFVQEALIRVYRHWPRLRGEAEARSYARKAVVSAVIDA